MPILRADPRSRDSSRKTWSGQSSQHETDHGKADESLDAAHVALEVAREPSVAADPGKRALDDPTLGQHDELVELAAFDDLDRPVPGCSNGGGHPWSLVAAIADDPLDEGEQLASTAHRLVGTVAVLDVGGVDEDAHEQAERVDQDVALAPRDFLARIVALRVDRGPPFCAALALCESMIAVVGLALRPSCSRTAT